MPSSFKNVCNFLRVITDRNHILPILYVSFLGFLRTDSSKSFFCMSDSRNFYGQIPASFKNVCNLLGVITDRKHILQILYVRCYGFLRTDSSKSFFCMSSAGNYYGQIPASLKNVCNFLGVITDRNRNLLILYVRFREFLRTDSSKL